MLRLEIKKLCNDLSSFYNKIIRRTYSTDNVSGRKKVNLQTPRVKIISETSHVCK